jgi:hypothetical protein
MLLGNESITQEQQQRVIALDGGGAGYLDEPTDDVAGRLREVGRGEPEVGSR